MNNLISLILHLFYNWHATLSVLSTLLTILRVPASFELTEILVLVLHLKLAISIIGTFCIIFLMQASFFSFLTLRLVHQKLLL
jgi:hypothetical protein